jgi:hypothetical protein
MENKPYRTTGGTPVLRNMAETPTMVCLFAIVACFLAHGVISSPVGTDLVYYSMLFNCCTADVCFFSHTDCVSCSLATNCGWCSSGEEAGKCMEGTGNGAKWGCTKWHYGSGSCDPGKGVFPNSEKKRFLARSTKQQQIAVPVLAPAPVPYSPSPAPAPINFNVTYKKTNKDVPMPQPSPVFGLLKHSSAIESSRHAVLLAAKLQADAQAK